MAYRLEKQEMNRGQYNWANPKKDSLLDIHITKVWGEIAKDEHNVDYLWVSVLIAGRPGQPVRLLGKDVFAHQLKKLAEESKHFDAKVNIGNDKGVPYLFVTGLEEHRDRLE